MLRPISQSVLFALSLTLLRLFQISTVTGRVGRSFLCSCFFSTGTQFVKPGQWRHRIGSNFLLHFPITRQLYVGHTLACGISSTPHSQLRRSTSKAARSSLMQLPWCKSPCHKTTRLCFIRWVADKKAIGLFHRGPTWHTLSVLISSTWSHRH